MTSNSFSHSLSFPSTSLENCSTRGDLLWRTTGISGCPRSLACVAWPASVVAFCLSLWSCFFKVCCLRWAVCLPLTANFPDFCCPWWASRPSFPVCNCARFAWWACCVRFDLPTCASWAGGATFFTAAVSGAGRSAFGPAAPPPALCSVLAYLGGNVLAASCTTCCKWARGGTCATVGTTGAGVVSGASMSFSRDRVSKSSAGAAGVAVGAAATLRGPWFRPLRSTPRRPPPIPFWLASRVPAIRWGWPCTARPPHSRSSLGQSCCSMLAAATSDESTAMGSEDGAGGASAAGPKIASSAFSTPAECCGGLACSTSSGDPLSPLLA
mmetsp:Transcript_12886/g.30934  ORF Transcript_12886/g.30934 Transcript_12886/m.30934 type:complete len:326 (-) Transcript_12886:480-1457(-)